MDVDEDDNFYAPEENHTELVAETTPEADPKPKEDDEDLEEGEEEDEEESDASDSDIEIVTERKDGDAAPTPARYNEIRNVPQRTSTSDAIPAVPSPAIKKEPKDSKLPYSPAGYELPGIATSKINVDAKPIYAPAGKPITQVNIDQDLNENDKPWRRPGTDVSDYFNYGFDEFTWALYASKQENLRSEFDQNKIAQNNKKMFEDMNMMMAMGGMPGMGGMATGGGEGMPPEMQAMMQQMMASGMDPSQMDPAAMFAGMQGITGASGAVGGAQGGFGQGQNQGMGYGYEQPGNSGGGGGGGGGRGNFGGRRGRGRGGGNW